MPLYDLICEVCCHELVDITLSVNDELPACEKCGNKMSRACNCKTFKLKYDPKVDTVGWAHDGYASSMYWKDVKDARARGEKVKGANEN